MNLSHKLLAILCISLGSLGNSTTEQNAPSSIADHLHLSHSKDPIDGGWLPNLTGLPTVAEMDEIDNTVKEAMNEETDSRCKSINPQLRMLFFEHFAAYQKMANAQNIYLNDNNAENWGHVMAMTLKESGGDSTNITDFKGHSFGTSKGVSNLQRWQTILTLSAKTHIQLNFQTNFGLTQTSADRVFLAFKLASDQKYDTSYLEGVEGASTPHQVPLNTAIAVRRLIWFYQDFAQGRIIQSDKRIHKADITKPEYSERYNQGLEAALRYCGTQYMFVEGNAQTEKLKEAMASISYCKLGNPQQGYGKNEVDEKCFAQLVTLCPALNIDIATITPLEYFATRKEKPICVGTFKRLLTKKPGKIENLLHDFKHLQSNIKMFK